MYKSFLTSTVTIFLTKEKIKMERLLRRHHNIENLSCLANVGDEPTFFADKGNKVREKGEKVTQNDVQRGQPSTYVPGCFVPA